MSALAKRVRTTESPAVRRLLTALALGFMGLVLVLGPLMEKRYGAGRYLAYIAITALVTGRRRTTA